MLTNVFFCSQISYEKSIRGRARFVPAPPEEYLTADAHVNFSGDWKCKEADGDLDAVFADMGIGQAPLLSLPFETSQNLPFKTFNLLAASFQQALFPEE